MDHGGSQHRDLAAGCHRPTKFHHAPRESGALFSSYHLFPAPCLILRRFTFHRTRAFYQAARRSSLLSSTVVPSHTPSPHLAEDSLLGLASKSTSSRTLKISTPFTLSRGNLLSLRLPQQFPRRGLLHPHPRPGPSAFFFHPLAPIITPLDMCLLVLHSTPANPATVAATTDTSGDLNPTGTSTSSGNSADRIAAAGSTALLFAALTVFIL